jgi:hypothetical protein
LISVKCSKAEAQPPWSHEISSPWPGGASHVEVQVSIVVQVCQSQPTDPSDARGLDGRGQGAVGLLKLDFQALVYDAHEIWAAIVVEVSPVGFV